MLDWTARRLLFVRLGTCLMLFSTIAWVTPIYEDTHHLGRDKWVLPEDHWGSRFSYSAYALTFGLYNYHAADVVGFKACDLQHPKPTRRARVGAAVSRSKKGARTQANSDFALGPQLSGCACRTAVLWRRVERERCTQPRARVRCAARAAHGGRSHREPVTQKGVVWYTSSQHRK